MDKSEVMKEYERMYARYCDNNFAVSFYNIDNKSNYTDRLFDKMFTALTEKEEHYDAEIYPTFKELLDYMLMLGYHTHLSDLELNEVLNTHIPKSVAEAFNIPPQQLKYM